MNESFEHCPYCGGSLQEKAGGGRSRMTCPSCGFVQYRNPAPAAGVIVLEGDDVLLVERRFEPFKGLWTIPAGFVEYDEGIEETAIRELLEETGLEITLDGLHAVEPCFDDPRGNTLLVLYDGHVTGGELRAGDDAAAARFHPLDGLPRIAFEAHRKVLGLLRERRTG